MVEGVLLRPWLPDGVVPVFDDLDAPGAIRVDHGDAFAVAERDTRAVWRPREKAAPSPTAAGYR